ncbi:Flp pilus assembly protein CpaB [Geodermatophilus sp. FMUSA9-8]|uniref:Flp pilus assembly protein CpaB n=1 Tax=Geodermatophilus sp. FMUSA9-8 TaxID=3120155 RepID=UPI00300BF37D
MRRRLLAGFTALAIAMLGAVILIKEVESYKEEARADEELVSVLVVDDFVPAGADAITVSGAVRTEEVPTRLVAPDAMTDISGASGKVTTTDLLPGEQLLTDRFVDPAALAPEGTVLAPAGAVEVTVALDAQRAAGGALQAGDKVGVQLTSQLPDVDGLTAYTVFKVFHQVLVTRVEVPTDAATGFLVTLAVSPADAELLVIGSTAQALYLSLETPAAGAAGTTASTSTTSGGDK